MEKILLLALYVVEVAKCLLLYRACADMRPKNYVGSVAGGVFYALVLGGRQEIGLPFGIAMMHLIVFAAMLTVVREFHLKTMWYWLVLIFGVTCLDEVLKMFFKIYCMVRGMDCAKDMNYYAGIGTLSFALVFIFAVWKEKNPKEHDRIARILSGKMALILDFMMAIGMLFTIAALNYAEKYVDSPRFQALSVVLCTVAYISIGALGVFTVYIIRTNEKMGQMVETERLFLDMQRHYYETLLEQEEDTRKFRHDLKNHLICINALAGKEDMAALRDYLAHLQENVQQIAQCTYTTGNQILNAIVNYYTAMLEEECKVQVAGKVTGKIDDVKLCTVFSNLLQNAVEELLRMKEGEEKKLYVGFGQGKEYLKITIRNSMSVEKMSEDMEALLVTGKGDAKNHGIGIYNVRRVVENMGGKLTLEKVDGEFQATVIMKIK